MARERTRKGKKGRGVSRKGSEVEQIEVRVKNGKGIEIEKKRKKRTSWTKRRVNKKVGKR